MNKRLKALADQSFKEVIETNDYNGAAYIVHEFDNEKFAELIIRECLQVVENQRDPPTLNYSPKARTADEIKRHFGIRE